VNTHRLESRIAEILIVEDDENDVVLTREGFKFANVDVNLHHVENGEVCMAFLRKEGAYADVPTPDLILLDLNMPVMDGRATLAAIAADPSLSHLPVIILTTSTERNDVVKMYRLRCCSYIPKPVDFKEFLQVIKDFSKYWFSVTVLPPE
jgi:CheY-like chemotaxis protein